MDLPGIEPKSPDCQPDIITIIRQAHTEINYLTVLKTFQDKFLNET